MGGGWARQRGKETGTVSRFLLFSGWNYAMQILVVSTWFPSLLMLDDSEAAFVVLLLFLFLSLFA